MSYFLKTIPRNYLLAALVIFLTLMFVSTWRLSFSPATWFDEGINLGIAKEWLNKGVYSLPLGPSEVVTTRQFLITTNYPVLAPVAASLALFGNSFWAARLPMVIYLIIFTALAILVAIRESNPRVTLWSAALIITFSPFYGNGKAVLGEVPGLVFFLAALLTLPKKFNPLRLFLVGVFISLSLATKPFFLICAVALLFGEIIFFRSDLKNLFSRLGIIALGATIPTLIWLSTILPSLDLAGVKSTVGYYSNSYAAASFFETIIKNVFRFVSETTPVHLMFMLSVSLVAWYQTTRAGLKASELKVVVGIFIALNLLWYLKTPGWYRYFFTAHLLIFIWFPAGLEKLFNKKIASIILSVFLLAQSAYLLTKRHDSLYYNTETVHAVETLNTLSSPTDSILFVNAPSLAFASNSANTYQFLQINRSLYFGRNSFLDQTGVPYKFIVVEGDLTPTALAPEINKLQAEYRAAATVGHYQIYRHL